MDETLKEKWSHFIREKKLDILKRLKCLQYFWLEFNEPNIDNGGKNKKTGINHNIAIDYYLKYHLMDMVLCGPYSTKKSMQTNTLT